MKEYRYRDDKINISYEYLSPILKSLLKQIKHKRIFDLGCGNGSFANVLSADGFSVTGVDPSEEGIRTAQNAYPKCNLHIGSCYDDLVSKFGLFPIVIRVEVVEHVYYPRIYAKSIYDLLEDDGVAIVTTPYHGYWKNLALSLLGKMDSHFSALWDNGHIKFWSKRTITTLFKEAGFRSIQIKYAGRFAPFHKSMIVILKK